MQWVQSPWPGSLKGKIIKEDWTNPKNENLNYSTDI